MSTSSLVLVVGSTGNLGTLISAAVLARGFGLRVLVRAASRGKVAALEAAGAEVVVGELDDPVAIEAAMAGVGTVVSALQGGPDLLVTAQLRLLRAAIAAGARRFIPSDFSLNFFASPKGANPNSDLRRAFADQAGPLAAGRIEVVHVLCGAFLDMRVLFGFLGAVDLRAGAVRVWGGGEQAFDVTSYADTARYVAAVATDPQPLPQVVNVAGESLTAVQLAERLTVATGRDFSVARLGSLADLDAEIGRRQHAEPTNLLAWLPLAYWRAMLNGTGKLDPIMNARYPDIRPASVVEYLHASL